MQSDEVKRMLEAAAAQPSGPLDARGVLRRGARLRRTRLAAAATGLAVVLAGASASLGVFGGGSRPDRGPGPAGPGRSETCEKLPPSLAVVIFLREGASTEEVAQLERELNESPDVASVRYVSPREAYEELKEWASREPERAEAFSRSDVPASFRIEAVDEPAVVRLEAKTSPAIEKVVSSRAVRASSCSSASLRNDDHQGLVPEDPPYPVFTDGDIRVQLVSLACSTSPLRKDGVSVRPAGRWCGVELRIANETDEPLSLDASTQILETATRSVYPVWDRAMKAVESARGFFAVPIEPGELRAGFLFFHLPADDEPASVQIAHGPRADAVFVDLGVDGCREALDGEDDISCAYDVSN